MPSRKGPSQRDPMIRLSQAVRTAAPASMGGRVTNASAVDPQPRKATRVPATGGPVLFVSTAAAGPPTDGSVFWYVTDESC